MGKGWLDNYNDSKVSIPEGMVGEGYSTKGRNYSPAWGGQFQDGGLIPIYNSSKKRWESEGTIKSQSKKKTKVQSDLPKVEAVNIQPIIQEPIIPNQQIDIRPTAEMPSSFDVSMQRYNMKGSSDYYQVNEEGVDYERVMKIKAASDAYNKYLQEKYGNEESLKNPKAAERLKQLRSEVNITSNYQMGGYVYPVNYVPEAQTGRSIGPTMTHQLVDQIGNIFNKKDNVRTIKIVDPRKKLATTNQPLRPNSDLVGGKYSSKHLDKLIQEAKRQKLSKQDILNLSAMGFQETKWDREDEGNIGHTTGSWKGKDEYEDFVNAYKIKMKEADRLKIKDPALRLQVYNGLGVITPKTEKDYHGFEMQKIYGVPVPKKGINMKQNPLYGKQVMDIRDNVLAKNPEYIKYIDSIYKAPLPNPKYNIDPAFEKIKGKKKAGKDVLGTLKKPSLNFGGSIPGAVGFTYARTNDPAPSNGPYAKKTKASAKDGEVIKDDLGQWAHPGEVTEINSPYITMQGVPYPVLGISDEGDVQMMYPEEEYQFVGNKVTEFPMVKNGLRQEQKGLVNLDNLTNFTNYNTKQPGGWLDKY